MTQINCPNCSKEISSSSPHCPHCGYSINQEKPKKKLSKKLRLLIILIPVFVIVLGVGLYFGLNYLKEQEQIKAVAAVSALIQEGQTEEAENQISQLKSEGYSDEKIDPLNVELEEYKLSVDEQLLTDAQTAVESGDFVLAKAKVAEMQGYVDASSIDTDIAKALLDEVDNSIQTVNSMIQHNEAYVRKIFEIQTGMVYGVYDNDTASAMFDELITSSDEIKAIDADTQQIQEHIDNFEEKFPREIVEDKFLELYDLHLTLLSQALSVNSSVKLDVFNDLEGLQEKLANMMATFTSISESATYLRSATYADYNK